MEELIHVERRAKAALQCQPEAASLPNTPPSDPLDGDESDRWEWERKDSGAGREAPAQEQSCAPETALSDAERVCAPLVFAESSHAKAGDGLGLCSRGSRSVVESSFITKTHYRMDPHMSG